MRHLCHLVWLKQHPVRHLGNLRLKDLLPQGGICSSHFLFSLTFLSWFQALQLPTQSEPWNSARFNHPLLLDPVAQPSIQQSFPPKEANVTAKEQEIVHPRIAGPLWRGDL